MVPASSMKHIMLDIVSMTDIDIERKYSCTKKEWNETRPVSLSKECRIVYGRCC